MFWNRREGQRESERSRAINSNGSACGDGRRAGEVDNNGSGKACRTASMTGLVPPPGTFRAVDTRGCLDPWALDQTPSVCSPVERDSCEIPDGYIEQSSTGKMGTRCSSGSPMM